ncbi:PEP-CTERM sorting domain-containing protein [Phenylobacterium sp.]|uniref:PEP-CTERM sorting domain-containing protein n=1 Tax=Phenylobacterium sp. TaxID=1871053 RepID=UPI0025D7917F|nr:PEP-CTERM sorting domain-containing protein [Phenylobacterium sp.]
MIRTIGALAVAAALALAAPAAGETLYSQAPNFNSSFSPSHEEGWRTLDEFHLEAASSITRIDWWGMGRTSLWDDEGLPAPLSFTIEFYSSTLDYGDPILPVADIEAGAVASFTVDAQWEATPGMQNSALPVQHYWYEFDTPLELAGEQTYWMGIWSHYPAATYGWYWLRGAPTGEPDPVYMWAKPAEDLYWLIYPDEQGGNFAFQLSGEASSAAPEPAAWLLMLTGAGLAGAALRRRRRPEPSRAYLA